MLPVVIIGVVAAFAWLAWELKHAAEEPDEEPPFPDLDKIRQHNWECWQEELREDIAAPKWRLKL
ncbi:MAG TPA: hypothetical protein PLI71_09955 [Clostridia bacterium]|nr:hypothetical protein [Clostridia bacterium]